MPAPPARKPAGVASYAEKTVPSAEVSVSPPCAATSPRTGGAGALLSSSWHMIDSLRPAPVDTLSPGADDGPTGRDGSAGWAYGISLIGGADLDFGGAEFAAPEVEFSRFSLIGGISAKVPPGVRVEVSGFTLLGGRSVRLPEPVPGAPVLRLRLFSIIGGISVRPR